MEVGVRGEEISDDPWAVQVASSVPLVAHVVVVLGGFKGEGLGGEKERRRGGEKERRRDGEIQIYIYVCVV